jgi:PmbA protein
VPDLGDLTKAAVEAAEGDESVEAYAEESTRTDVDALRGEVEGLTFAESRGVGVRLLSGGRLGYAYAADPSPDEVRQAVARARENAALATPDEFNVLADAEAFEAMPEIFRAAQADIPTDRKVALALDVERRAVSSDPRVTKVDLAEAGDGVSRVAIASTTGMAAEYARTDAWAICVTLAVDGDETQTGFSYRIARELDELSWEEVVDEAVERAVRMLGAVKPPTARVPIVLDQFAGKAGEKLGSDLFTLVDDGRVLEGPGACPFDDEGVPSRRTELFTDGVLNGFLHNTYTAMRMGDGVRSTGNAQRGSYRGTPDVGTTNFYLEAGDTPVDELYRRAEGGVLIQDVSGAHSGANPITGQFSVGATGLRILPGGELGEPLREMTIASTLNDMLAGVTGVGDDLRFFSSVGVPSILIGEMTVAGV